MITLIALPPEVLYGVLKAIEPEDLAVLMSCCWALHDFIYNNRQLFKELYLQRLDNPVQGRGHLEVDWEKKLKSVVKLQKILASENIEEKKANFVFLAETIVDILRTATPRPGLSLNISLLESVFKNDQNREVLLCSSTSFQRARGKINGSSGFSRAERQLSAKLHCLYGIALEKNVNTRSSRSYPYACSVVYDLRNFTENTFWGPFKNDGSSNVDWEKMEAIRVVCGHNWKAFGQAWVQPFKDAVPGSYVPASILRLRNIQPLPGAQDPFNITGIWMRIVCFLDFPDFFQYNFDREQLPATEPRPPLNIHQTIRVLRVEIHVIKIEGPGKDDDPRLPVVHFKGTSNLEHSAHDPDTISALQGTIRLTREGEVRWTSVSLFQGETRWKSEGIQVGGIGSAQGVLGHWFNKDYDDHGPAGPTAFWKVCDAVETERDEIPEILSL